jgi:hypothetical protein
MHLHDSRALTAEEAALAAITSDVGADDAGASYLDEAALLAHLDPRGLATDEGVDRQMRAADIDSATTRASKNTGWNSKGRSSSPERVAAHRTAPPQTPNNTPFDLVHEKRDPTHQTHP